MKTMSAGGRSRTCSGAMLERPQAHHPHYGDHLGDASYWGAYVDMAVAGSRLPTDRLEVPFVGTFPTFLVGELVVKLFGEAFDGARCYETELAMYGLLADHSEIPAPSLVAVGELFPGAEEWSWPYLVTRRLSGEPVRVLDRSRSDLTAIASRLGEVAGQLHRLIPPAPIASREVISALRRSAPERLKRFGLPRHLLEQVPEYLDDGLAPPVLVHADITADHVFLDRGRLEGIIDWGDAMVADRYYEFVAVYLDALAGSPELFRAFLDGYGLREDDHLGSRCLRGILEFQFDAIKRVKQLVNLDSVANLDELAERLYAS
jgi:hygromycin-B 7''-O-kinase